MKPTRPLLCLATSAIVAACSPAAQNGNLPDQPQPTASSSATASGLLDSTNPTGFLNPGGMWMPEQMPAQAETLKKLGFTIEPSALGRPTEFPLGAVVWLGGCSASFVSPDGLVITNHHCVTGALQYNSDKEHDLIKDGYLAKTRADEKWAGPTARIQVTTELVDVTADMTKGLDALPDDMARHQALEDREKKIVGDCEAGKPGTRCSVVSYFGGAQYRRVTQLEIKDVRLVYAPPEGIGNYGGEIDNWRWPRHGGDFSFYRAYVGKDGKPADHGKDNVPFKPPFVLKLASSPLRAGDPVMVAGYPARTNRVTTAAEASEAVSFDLPYIVDFCEVYLAELERVTKGDKDLAIKAETFVRGLGNWLTNTKGQIEGLTKGGLAKKKADNEAALAAWISGDPARKAKYGSAIEDTTRAFMDSRKTKEADASTRELLRMVRLFSAAHTIVRNAEERAKPNDARDPDYQERNQQRLEQGLEQLSKSYSPVIDGAMLRLVVKRELALPEAKRAGIALALLGKPKGDKGYTQEEIDKTIDGLFKGTKLGDEKGRIKLLKTAKTTDLARSQDPMIKLALALRPVTRAYEERGKRLDGAMSLVRPKFASAMRDMKDGMLAPDANRTLRVTFGTVRGYAPTPDKPVYFPFTKLSEVVAKNTGKDPFEAPKGLLDAVAAKKLGPYVDAELGDVPVDFLADLDITGGNSGSATLNARGELVGLAFDGNYESMASDWIFVPEVTRSIHVDLRYVLWVLDAVANADDLLKELGVEPKL